MGDKMTPDQLVEWAHTAEIGYSLPGEEEGHAKMLPRVNDILTNRGLKLCWCHPYAHVIHVIPMTEDGIDR